MYSPVASSGNIHSLPTSSPSPTHPVEFPLLYSGLHSHTLLRPLRNSRHSCIGRTLPRHHVSTSGEWYQRGARRVREKDFEVHRASSIVGLAHGVALVQSVTTHVCQFCSWSFFSPSDLTIARGPRSPLSEVDAQWRVRGFSRLFIYRRW